MYAGCQRNTHCERSKQKKNNCVSLCVGVKVICDISSHSKLDWQDKQQWKTLQREATKQGGSGAVEREPGNKSSEELPPSVSCSLRILCQWLEKEGVVFVCCYRIEKHLVRVKKERVRCRTSIFLPLWLFCRCCILGNRLFFLFFQLILKMTPTGSLSSLVLYWLSRAARFKHSLLFGQQTSHAWLLLYQVCIQFAYPAKESQR